MDLAEDIAELLGIYQNQSYLGRKFPWLWKPLTWVRVVLFRIPLHIGFTFARKLWTDISAMAESPENKVRPIYLVKRKTAMLTSIQDDGLVGYLVHAYASPDGYLSLRTRMWIMVLILTFLFASLHQTSVYSSTSSLMVEADTIRATIMIWVTFHLALRQDCQEYLRDEVSSILSSRELNDSNPVIDVQTMQDAVKADSFIREVLRMKGDLVNLVRAPVRDIELGGYIIPKGGNLNSIFIYSVRVNLQTINR